MNGRPESKRKCGSDNRQRYPRVYSRVTEAERDQDQDGRRRAGHDGRILSALARA